MKKVYYLFLFALCMGCVKPQKPNYLIDPNLKRFFDWKQGSFWIYIDSVTGKSDSFSVTEYFDNPMDYEPDYTKEQITILLNGYSLPEKHNIKRLSFSMEFNNSNLSIDSSGNFVVYHPFMNYPIELGYIAKANYYDTTDTTALNIQFFPSFLLNGNLYDSVYVIHYHYDNKMVDDFFYINRKNGLIKIQLNDYVSKANYNLISAKIYR